ncbi:NAD(P)/FAD-dependent oxidoreductase [Marinibaculum pumilum]|uniref:NAD(P)/FAD-dependent oxidoreductase n=1 Tax=Marinibaculum pumilum TaxID=1766165 RepID=A0ABV7L611_9PROT
MAAGSTPPYVVIGGGQAGFWAADTLRKADPDRECILLAAEPLPPHERPPLSKGYLLGRQSRDSLLFRAPDFYAAAGIDLRLSCPATAIDPDARTVTLADGTRLSYQAAMIATGARLRRLSVPGADLTGIHYLRSVTDADSLGQALRAAGRVAVIGGGFIGMEVAAAARELGCAVTVVEAEPRIMNRGAPAEISDAIAALHAAKGVTILTGRRVTGFAGDRAVAAVELDGHAALPCDLAVVGIGIQPETGLAEAAGIACRDGILVDAWGRTSAEAVFAAGDVARREDPGSGLSLRQEAFQNAQGQAVAAAKTMAGQPTPYLETPWLWSDQYDENVQIAGIPAADDRLILRGDPAARAFTVLHLRSGRLVAASVINTIREMRACRRLIEAGLRVPEDATEAELADPEVRLLDLTRRLKGR